MSAKITATVIVAIFGILTVAVLLFFMLLALNGYQERDTFGPFVLYGVGSLVVVAVASAACWFLTGWLIKLGRGAFFSAAAAIIATGALVTTGQFMLLFGAVIWAESTQKWRRAPATVEMR